MASSIIFRASRGLWPSWLVKHLLDLGLEVFRRFGGQLLFRYEGVFGRLAFEGGDDLLRLPLPYSLQLVEVLHGLFLYGPRDLPHGPRERPDGAEGPMSSTDMNSSKNSLSSSVLKPTSTGLGCLSVWLKEM